MTIPGLSFSPVNANLLERLIRRADRALTLIEREQLRRITAEYLLPIRGNILSELQRRYPNALADVEGKSDAWRLARGRLLAAELTGVADAALSESVEQGLRAAVGRTAVAGLEEALQLLDTFEPGLATQLVDSLAINYQAVNNLAVTMGSHLHRYGEDFIQKAQSSVIESLVRGEGVRKAGTRLRHAYAQTAYNAERIVRTEMHQAQDLAVRTSYEASGIEYVQRIATMDDRVCGYCAERAGKVYRVEEAPASLHPHDRCYNLPWRPEWEENGVVDTDWIKAHHAETVQRLKDAGGELHTGLAPFERMNQLPVPRTAWSPAKPTAFTPLERILPPLSEQFPLVVNLSRAAVAPVVTPAAPPKAPAPAPPTPAMTDPRWAQEFADSDFRSFMQQYTGSSGVRLNEILRQGGELDGAARQQLLALQQRAATSLLETDQVLYRGLSLDESLSFLDPRKLIGTTISGEGAFQSATFTEATARSFVQQQVALNPARTPTLLRIRPGPGTRGLVVPDSISAFAQQEVIFPAGTDFRIVSVEWTGKIGSSARTLELVVDVVQTSVRPDSIGRAAAQVAAAVADDAARAAAAAAEDVVPSYRSLTEQSDALARTIKRENPAGAKAVDAYTGDAFTDVNSRLWTGRRLDAGDDIAQVIDDLDSVFQRPDARLGSDATLYRSYTVDLSELPSNPQKMVGTVIDHKGYASTSRELGTPTAGLESLAEMYQEFGDEPPGLVMMKIQARRGDVAIPIEGLSANPHELEVLYNRGTQFRIVQAERIRFADLVEDVGGILIDPDTVVYQITVEAVR